LQVRLRESIVLQEASDFVVNVLTNLGFVTVLKFEFVDEHALQLLPLLNVHQLLLTGFSHASGL